MSPRAWLYCTAAGLLLTVMLLAATRVAVAVQDGPPRAMQPPAPTIPEADEAAPDRESPVAEATTDRQPTPADAAPGPGDGVDRVEADA